MPPEVRPWRPVNPAIQAPQGLGSIPSCQFLTLTPALGRPAPAMRQAAGPPLRVVAGVGDRSGQTPAVRSSNGHHYGPPTVPRRARN
jgi:hypothetical protein